MVSINGLPPARIPGGHRTSKAKKKPQADHAASEVAQTSKVATAVSHSIRHMDASDFQRAQVQYDLPEGRSRKALEEYMDIMNHSRKEELAQLLGVDIYI
ncbi:MULTISPECIES: chromosome partitioning protein ParA [Vibrio]|uniref:Chromosome partitioning protein ParA n=1 Tax=Vibrio ostreae TaxID=2841925 RepID=A0A975YQ29_9VIBR|nr:MULTISPECIES: chromosome partitioning protein ParA [Vibrio]QXO19171.1 chromosome partitioning protein ParA [Vibrio ostreae]WGY46487.1 chromosome partitioning protein ParA [Vibrio sp. ABG19]